MTRKAAKTLTAASLLVGAALVQAACATATPYQPAGENGFGYHQQQLENNRYRVSFIANAHTDSETVQNYLLYRAAQITLDSGNDYFIIVHQGLEGRGGGGNNVSVGTGGGFGIGGGSSFGIGIGTLLGGRGHSVRAYATIVVGQGSKPADQPHAYNAHHIKQRLQSEIGQPVKAKQDPSES